MTKQSNPSWGSRFASLVFGLSRRPSLIADAVHANGLCGAIAKAVAACRSGFGDEAIFVSMATMGEKPEDIARVCASFVDRVEKLGDATLLVQLHGGARFFVRAACAAKDLWLLRETFFQSQATRRYDVAGKLVLDIGANLGDTAIYFALQGARVMAWEPSKELADLASRNCVLNGLTVDFRNAGIGDRQGTLVLHSTGSRADFASSTRFPGQTTNLRTAFRGGAEERVAVIPFSDVLDGMGDVFLAKFNCEGCEYPALMSLSAARMRQVEHYAVDCHARLDTLAKRFADAGFGVKTSGATLFADRVAEGR